MTAHPLLEQLYDAIRRHRLTRAGDGVVVAVSGGPDSVALLDGLLALRGALGLRLLIGHVDHQLRTDSADDAAFVEALARRHGLDAVIVRRAVAAECARQGWSLEDGARRVRYAALQDIAQRHAAARIAVAHTADDQAETVMLRLLRGSGVAGLSAMAWSRPMGAVRVIRPLLGVWRSTIEDYLAVRGLTVRRDASNEDPRFTRNRVRHELLPWLEARFNPNVKATLVRLAEQCRIDGAYLRQAAQRQWRRLVKAHGDGLAIRLAPFRRQAPAVRGQIIRLAIEALQGTVAGFESRHWGEIEMLMTTRPDGSVVDLPHGLRVQKRGECVILRPADLSAGRDLDPIGVEESFVERMESV